MPAYRLTLHDACERLEAARGLLVSLLDPIDRAADDLDAQAVTATMHAERHTEKAQRYHTEAAMGRMLADHTMTTGRQEAAADPQHAAAILDAAREAAGAYRVRAAHLENNANQHQRHADTLTRQAEQHTQQASLAHALIRDAGTVLDLAARRLTVARSGDEGTAKALDEAAHLIDNAADWIDATRLLPTSQPEQARTLTRDARA